MKSKFEPDVDLSAMPTPARLIDPEAFDATEQRFAVSVEANITPPRFVADSVEEPTGGAGDRSSDAHELQPTTIDLNAKGTLECLADGSSLQTELLAPQDSESWRNEVTARVNNYRARRRPRAPRYPSLQLKFDPPEASWSAHANAIQSATSATPNRLAVVMQTLPAVPQQEISIQPRTNPADVSNAPEAGARILEFPRSAASPPQVFDELAEPVVDRPRILEVPEVLLPPPALGGILIDPVEEPAKERRPGFELPLQAASLSQRLSAGAIDGLLVTSAFAVFAYIFFRVTSSTPPPGPSVIISVALAAVFWMAYQYLLLVHTGTTPGLKLAHLQLSRFDGTAVPRRIRRWRVLASMLSALSLGLGYAWCFLDEDRLCWHDRITRTYMGPKQH